MKALFLLLLISFPSHPNTPTKEELQRQREMALIKEKDDQEYRLAVLKVVGTVSLAVIAALVQIYLSRNK